MKKTPLKRKSGMRRKSKSPNAILKDEIQALLRQIVIKRDGGCWLRHYPESGQCGGYRQDGELILQAEHLETRSNASTFADSRLVVCICKRHHIYWKPQHSARYNELAEKFIGKQRSQLWQRVREDILETIRNSRTIEEKFGVGIREETARKQVLADISNK